MEISATDAAKVLQAYRRHRRGGRNGGRNGICPECFGHGYVIQLRLGSEDSLRELVRPTCPECSGAGKIAPKNRRRN